jgi:hypothetical protein
MGISQSVDRHGETPDIKTIFTGRGKTVDP